MKIVHFTISIISLLPSVALRPAAFHVTPQLDNIIEDSRVCNWSARIMHNLCLTYIASLLLLQFIDAAAHGTQWSG